jgi:RNA polymerase sigma-70 factor (ECF subfamily)
VKELAPSSATTAASEETLLAGLRRGDGAAFEQLLRLHGARLMVLARRLLGNEEEARDALQDAFVALVRSIGDFDGRCQLSTWLHRIVVNAALMRLRRRRRHPEVSIDALLPRYYEDGHRVNPRSAWDPSPAALLQRSETASLVQRCLEALPEDYRTIFILRDVQELGTAETATILEIQEGAVKTRLHRARQALRTLLERELSPSP